MPSGLIEDYDGMSPRRDGGGDFRQMQVHPLRITPGQHEPRSLSLCGADCPINIGRCRALVLWCRRPRSASCPATGDPILLTDAGLVLPPKLYWCVVRKSCPDCRHPGGEVFLNVGMAASSCV